MYELNLNSPNYSQYTLRQFYEGIDLFKLSKIDQMIFGGLLSADGDVFFCRRTTVERRQWCRLCTRRSCTLPGWATRRQPSSLMATLTSWLSRVTRQKMRYVFHEVNEVFRTSLGSFTKLIQACWWDRTRLVCCSMDYSCRWNDSACTMKEGR